MGKHTPSTIKVVKWGFCAHDTYTSPESERAVLLSFSHSRYLIFRKDLDQEYITLLLWKLFVTQKSLNFTPSTKQSFIHSKYYLEDIQKRYIQQTIEFHPWLSRFGSLQIWYYMLNRVFLVLHFLQLNQYFLQPIKYETHALFKNADFHVGYWFRTFRILQSAKASDGIFTTLAKIQVAIGINIYVGFLGLRRFSSDIFAIALNYQKHIVSLNIGNSNQMFRRFNDCQTFELFILVKYLTKSNQENPWNHLLLQLLKSKNVNQFLKPFKSRQEQCFNYCSKTQIETSLNLRFCKIDFSFQFSSHSVQLHFVRLSTTKQKPIPSQKMQQMLLG
eukprot:TRINITY_DN513_c1_g1_i3.p1 TRINITY_DN513_c1_g1~~TRINITY_DN513_c1_g1_i3.p1  ORF type:complete len:332 (-),score=-14.00 TRINITY_DN513_c1_g1_i3:1922-2917(-)